MANGQGVLVIYTGGTIGSKPRDPDPESPQIVVGWSELKAGTPELIKLEADGMVMECAEVGPLDSCNVGLTEWLQIASIIEARYDDFEGFVILHGTDTMVYTASALSFMLRELAKPVILTGAQRSALVDVRNDATQNFITSLLIACPSYSKLPVVPEVCIYFGGTLLRGNRAVKRDTESYVAYESPNLEPLGEFGNKMIIHSTRLRPMPDAGRQFNVRKSLGNNVTSILIYPGIQQTDLVERQLEGLLSLPSNGSGSLKAAIVMAYGSGDIPTRWPDWLEVFRTAHAKGIIIVAVSQCKRGSVELGIYETSALLLELGFVAADNITLEAALCKLMVLLGQIDITQEEVEDGYQRAIAGEQNSSVIITRYPGKPGSVERKGDQPANVRIPGRNVESGWQPALASRALLRFRGAKLFFAGDGPVLFTVYLNLDRPEDASPQRPGFAGSYKKQPTGDKADQIIVFDVTRVVTALVRPGERASFTVFVDTPDALFSWSSVELAILAREL